MKTIYHIVYKYLTTQLVAVQFLSFDMRDRFCALLCSDFFSRSLSLSLFSSQYDIHYSETGDCAPDSRMGICFVCILYMLSLVAAASRAHHIFGIHTHIHMYFTGKRFCVIRAPYV